MRRTAKRATLTHGEQAMGVELSCAAEPVAQWVDGYSVEAIRGYLHPRHTDHRGWLQELWRLDESSPDNDQRVFGGGKDDYQWLRNVPPAVMAYLSLTRANMSRGPHEHERQWDRFVVLSGSVEFFLWRRSNEHTRRACPQRLGYRERIVPSDLPFLLVVPPRTVHAYRAISDTLMLNLPSSLYGGWRNSEPVDEIRHENDPDSLYQFWGPNETRLYAKNPT